LLTDLTLTRDQSPAKRKAVSAYLKFFAQRRDVLPSILKIGTIALLVLCLYARVLADLAKDWWREPSLSYGLLVPPLALYVGWLRREASSRIPKRTDQNGLFLIGLSCSIYTVGILGAEFFLPRISFVLLLAGLVWTFWGTSQLKVFAFPLFLLATMVPLPVIVYNLLSSPLQLLASNWATELAQACGVSAYRDGNIIYLANMSLGVEEACSGLNSLSALMVGGLLLGFVNGLGPVARFLLCAFSIPIAIIVNILRVTGTAILADHNAEFAGGFYHSFTGWLVFVLGFLWLYATSAFLAKLLKPAKSA
jgi:exosortase